jgi:hypothetical protein
MTKLDFWVGHQPLEPTQRASFTVGNPVPVASDSTRRKLSTDAAAAMFIGAVVVLAIIASNLLSGFADGPSANNSGTKQIAQESRS